MEQNEELRVGDFVKYEKIKGKIISISKNDAMVESDGIKLRVPLKLLKKVAQCQKSSKNKYKHKQTKQSKCNFGFARA